MRISVTTSASHKLWLAVFLFVCALTCAATEESCAPDNPEVFKEKVYYSAPWHFRFGSALSCVLAEGRRVLDMYQYTCSVNGKAYTTKASTKEEARDALRFLLESI